ncbi:hypothetical protein ACFSNA_02640 [Pedobacter mendelii]|uniref:hypothetical protein n=1 Tax=Pedobacter mendelii TaxID=1908240 RepID=UPI00361D5BC7
MSKSEQYHLYFLVSTREDGSQNPYVESDRDNTGSTINSEISSFISLLGPKLTDGVIFEIYSCNPFTSINNGYSVEGSFEETVEIFSPPPRAVFNNGGSDVVIPVQDFIDILYEWKNFLLSLPYKHSLSNR